MDLDERLNMVLFESTNSFIPDLRDLNKYKIPFIVIGGRAINAYLDRPRSTLDIDIVTNKPQEMATAILQDIPQLERVDGEAVIRLKTAGREIIDIIKPYHEIFNIAMRNTIEYNGVQIPTIEAMIAMKFAAIMSSSRKRSDKMQDCTDIGKMLARGPDLEKAGDYSESLYNGAKHDFTAFVKVLQTEVDG